MSMTDDLAPLPNYGPAKSSVPIIKTPMGLKPRDLFLQERNVEVLEACERYAWNGRKIPAAWISELIELHWPHRIHTTTPEVDEQ